jgi:hypothetical protein
LLITWILPRNDLKTISKITFDFGCGRKARRKEGDNECYSETKKYRSWGM